MGLWCGCWGMGLLIAAAASPGQSTDDPARDPPPQQEQVEQNEQVEEAAGADEPKKSPPVLTAANRAAPSTEADLLRQQIGLLRNVLHEDAMGPKDRQQAAVQLLQIGTAEAIAVLVEGLAESDSQAVFVAIADGMLANGPPPAPMREPVLQALLRADRGAEALLIRAATRFDPDEVIPVLVEAARGDEQPDGQERRTRAVRALGAFYEDAAIEALIELLQATDQGPLRQEVLRALESSTGLTGYSADAEAWQAWWTQQKRTPREERLVSIIRTLRAEVDARDERIEELRGRFVRMIQLLYTATPPEQRSALLADLLRDEEPPVRRTATDLVERAMGDAVALDDTVSAALRELIRDGNADLRARASRLLLNLGDAQIGPLVAQAYLVEHDPAARREFLQVLTRAPQPEVFDLLVQQLAHGVLTAQIGQALLAASDQALLSEAHQTAIRDTLRAADPAQLPASGVRLLARFGSDTDRAELLPMLESAAAEIKTALARELAPRPEFTDLLVRLAKDPVLYPHSLDALLRTRVNLEGARTLLALRPNGNGETEELWLRKLTEYARALPLHSVRVVDDDLLTAEAPLLCVRAHEQVLEAVRERQATAPEQHRAEWIELLTRLAALRMQQERLAAAAAVLDQLRPAQPATDLYKRLQAEAYLRQGRLADAAQVLPEAGLWLDVAETLQLTQPERFAAICQEVEDRFGEELDDGLRERLSNLLALVPQPEEAATESDAGEAGGAAPGTADPQEVTTASGETTG